MTFENNVEQIFTQWGIQQRQMPLKSEALKTEVLSKLHASEIKSARAWKMPWLSVSFAALAVIVLLISSSNNRLSYPTSAVMEKNAAMDSGLRYQSDSLGSKLLAPFREDIAIYPIPPTQNGVPSTDNREFLKKDYGASIKSRHVQELSQRIETTVRGFGGRIDNSSNSERSGFISFVVPADKFDAFRNEIKTLVGKKVFTDNISTQNLLPEKRSIEEQQTSAQATLDKLRADRDKLISVHNSTAASLQSQINSTAKQLSDLQKQEQTPQIQAQERDLQNRLNSLRAQLAQENSNYSSNLNSLDNQIQYAETNLKNLDKQNTNLLDNIATVQGNISISWISIWEIIKLYLPIHWLTLLLILAAIITYLVQRRQTRLIIP